MKLAYPFNCHGINLSSEQKLDLPPAFLAPVNTRYGVFFLSLPAGSDNPSWIGNIWPSHWFLETLLRFYRGLAGAELESEARRRWRRWAGAPSRCESATHSLSRIGSSQNAWNLLPGDGFIRRSLAVRTLQEALQKKMKECVWAVFVYTLYNIFIRLHLVLELKVSLLK